MSNRSFRGIRSVRFSDFELDVRAFELRRSGARIRLQEQPLRILTALLERPGELVTREEIRKRLWPNGTAVEVSHGINAAVQRLREALGETAGNPRYIETLARRGYRFIGPVEIGVRTPSGGALEAPPIPEMAPPASISHFRVLERLGAGGMGMVYRAEDQKLGRHVALKFLPPSLGSDSAALARFRLEAQAASALNHPNICTVYGVEECEGKPVIVMEYIEGESLEAALRRGPLAPERATSIATQIAAALDAAHRKGIVHRDLKPGNILLTGTTVKVLDFGLAKMERPPALGFEPAHVTSEGAILGTLHYLSPEQVQGQPAGPRSDIFSFGATFYEMLAGHRAFEGPNAAHVMAAILTLEPPPLAPGVPPALDLAMRRCLAKEPEERWQSARDLKAALEWLPAAQEGESEKVAAQRATSARGLLGIATALVVLLLFAGLYYERAIWSLRPRPSASSKETSSPSNAVAPTQPVAASPEKGAGVKTLLAAGMPRTAIKPEPARTAELKLADGAITHIGLSPDGERIAYISGGVLSIAGVDGDSRTVFGPAVGMPFWSPDGRYVAASFGKELRRFDLESKGSSTICSVDTNLTGAWATDGSILIGLLRDGLYRTTSGGALQRVTTVDAAQGESRHIALQFLPGGRRFLFLAGSGAAGHTMLYAGSLDSNERAAIMPAPSNVQFVARPGSSSEGYLLYAADGMITARSFNWKTLKLIGREPVLLGQIASRTTARDAAVDMADFSVAGNTLAARAPSQQPGRLIVIRNWMSSVQ
jgi:serine/threonine protein kinase